VKAYFTINATVYNTDEKKVMTMLTYMMLRQQVLDMEEAARMEEEALRAQEAERKRLADLEKVRQAEEK
jgi:hypothetical protein